MNDDFPDLVYACIGVAILIGEMISIVSLSQ